METQSSSQETYESGNNDNPGIGWQILAFLLPLAGLIMYFNVKNEYPNKAKRYITLAGIGFALNLIIRFGMF